MFRYYICCKHEPFIMSSYKNILKKIDDEILTITIDRPDKMNALNALTQIELKKCIEYAYDENEVKGIIIRGAGKKAFAAGADIGEFSELNELNGRKFAENGQELMALIESCHKPVIALVNGYALGGGCELAMACHLRVATTNAFFGLPEASLGIIPGFGGTQRLTQLVGKGKALEMMLTAEKVTAQEAYAAGLVNHLAEDIDKALEICREILFKIFKNSPLSVGMIINGVNAYYSKSDDGYQIEANSFANCCKSEDFREGAKAFFEKREPHFNGD